MKKRVLVVYYSFTQQTRILLKRFCSGLEEQGIDVDTERLEPVNPYEFPFQNDLRLASVMFRTFFMGRKEVKPVSEKCFEDWDYVVLAGPTWSYFPSGPILDFLDKYSEKILSGKKVLPVISCRSYWRLHNLTLRQKLKTVSAELLPPVVFEHPTREPYRVLGLLFKLRGKRIKGQWFRKNYESYGHSKAQAEEAFDRGVQFGKKILVDDV